MQEPKISLSSTLEIAQSIVDRKGIKEEINVDTKLYSKGYFESIDVLDLFLKLERANIRTSHLSTNSFDSVREIYEAISISK